MFAIFGLILFFVVLGCLYMVWMKYCGHYEESANQKQWRFRVKRVKHEKKKSRYVDPNAPPEENIIRESSVYSGIDREIDWENVGWEHLGGDDESQQSAVDLSDIAISIQPDAADKQGYNTAGQDAGSTVPPGPNADKPADASGHLSKINEADSEIVDDCQSEITKGLQTVTAGQSAI